MDISEESWKKLEKIVEDEMLSTEEIRGSLEVTEKSENRFGRSGIEGQTWELSGIAVRRRAAESFHSKSSCQESKDASLR